MADLFFSFSGHNYARYMTFFSLLITNTETSHLGSSELLQRGAISAAQSFIPGIRCAIDRTMEETFMKHSKSHAATGCSSAGLSGILMKYNAYQRWVRTAHERTKYVECTRRMAEMIPDQNKDQIHKDVRPSRMKKNEQDVDKTLHAVQNFIDPFAMDDTEHLYNITSGAPAPPNIETVVLRAEAAGAKAKEDFIKERLENNKPFFDPVKRIHLKTFSDMNKSAKLKASRNKVIEYKQQGNTALQLLVKSQNQQSPLDLKELMTYPLTLVPYCTGTSGGFLAKTDKSKGFHFLTTDFADALDPPNNNTLFGRRWECMFLLLKRVTRKLPWYMPQNL